jgi:drug/metabolite transporter (DMT)-like permease
VTPRQAALLGVLAALWGSSYLLIKYALAGFSPGEVVWGRAAIAALVLVPVCLGRPATRAALRATARRPRPVLLLGLLAVATPFLLISYGETAVASGLTAIFIAPSPIFVAALAPLLDPSERLRPAGWAGLAVGLAGVALLVGVESLGSLDELLGSIAILTAALSYALGSYVVKDRFAGVPPIAASACSLTAAALLVTPVAAATARGSAPGLGAVAALVALGAAHTALAFVIFYELIANVGAGRANLVSYLTPPFALAYGASLRGEPITPASLGGLALILAGVALASRRAARRREAPVSRAGSGAPPPAWSPRRP